MKTVVSISLGSSERDHRAVCRLGGEKVRLVRLGTNGDIGRAAALIRRLDGCADAIGLGGIDRYLTIGRRRYTFRQAEKLAQQAKRTPVADGSLMKTMFEREAVRLLAERLGSLTGRKVLLLCAVDRYGMAEEFARQGADIVCGDLVFGLSLPCGVRSLTVLRRLAGIALPVITRLPIRWLYPVGRYRSASRGKRFFDEAEIVAGDFHFLRRYLPPRLDGKIVVTNTTTPRDRELLHERGVRLLVTTTPILGGRAFGTNVIEAMLTAVYGDLTQEAARRAAWEQANIRPTVTEF